MYFDEVMRTATSPDFPITTEIMCKDVVGPATLNTMMHMLLDELNRGAQELYPDAMEARFRFQNNVTAEHTDIIKDYQSWHQYDTIDQHEDVEQLDFYSFLSQNDV